MSTSNKFIKNSAVYVFFTFLQKSLGFLLLPLYTVYLSRADYGTINLIISFNSFLTIFIVMSLNSAAIRYHFNNLDDKSYQASLWGTIASFILLNSVLIVCILLLGRSILVQPFLNGIDFYPYILVGILILLFNPIYNFFQSYLQARQIAGQFALNNLLYFLSVTGFSLLFIIVFHMKALGMLLAYLISGFIFMLYAVLYLKPRVKVGLNKAILKKSFGYSLPLIPHDLSGILMSILDRFFLNFFKTTSVVGLYMVGFQFGNIVSMVATAVNQAYGPWFFENMTKGEAGRKKIVTFSESIVLAYCFLALFLAYFSPEVLKFMVHKNFYETWKVIPFLSFGFVFTGIYYLTVASIFWVNSKYVPIITFSGILINIIVNSLLIPRFGMIGAAITNLFTLFGTSVISFSIGRKVNKVGFNWKWMYGMVFIFLTLSMLVFAPISFGTLFTIKLTVYAILVSVFLYFKYNKIIWMMQEFNIKPFKRKDNNNA
jgi:O-antigen/teichoic acid export membrane protein